MGEVRLVPYTFERHGDGPKQVISTVFREYGWEWDDQWEEDVVRPDLSYGEGRFLVGEEADGRVVGTVGISEVGPGVCKLNRLYVLPEARRTGLGNRLVHWVIDEARRLGAHRLILFSDINFVDAHRLYERNGFRRTKFRYAPDHWQSREWGFELNLQEVS